MEKQAEMIFALQICCGFLVIVCIGLGLVCWFLSRQLGSYVEMFCKAENAHMKASGQCQDQHREILKLTNRASDSEAESAQLKSNLRTIQKLVEDL
jgi:uncharacterized protein YlxW (UPF0749 family)